ncbi:MAG TPA: copper-containing nitrite reductase [Alphaproteobacteria bacterium]|nr:copper-containing nitrite reductase [Alphaproteobacteria bacterium]
MNANLRRGTFKAATIAAGVLAGAGGLGGASLSAAEIHDHMAAPIAVTAATASLPDIARDPADLPPAIGARGPRHVRVDLETVEAVGRLADGTSYPYWTFTIAGQPPKVPGPMIRVRVGDVVELHLRNNEKSTMTHNIDLHAVSGPHGGGMATVVAPGEEKSFSFTATTPGLYVYHCATAPVALHIASGMFGMILVEPAGGLPKVDHEYYVVQSDMYTDKPFGAAGEASPDYDKIVAETPDYFVFNGTADALVTHPLRAKTGETVLIFFGDAGPNKAASFHVIGQIMSRLYMEGALLSRPVDGVQTTTVAPGGAVVAEFKPLVPGTYALVDHAIIRTERGAKGLFIVDGPGDPSVFAAQPRTASLP